MMQPISQQYFEDTRAADPGVVATAVSLIRWHAGRRQPTPRLSEAARHYLVTQFPGADTAGLEACIQRALVLCESDVIQPGHLALPPNGSTNGGGEGDTRETAAILASLQAARGRRRQAAASLGIAPRTLRLKLADLRARGFAVPAGPTRGDSRHV